MASNLGTGGSLIDSSYDETLFELELSSNSIYGTYSLIFST